VSKIQQTGQADLLERLKQAQHRYGYLPQKTIARIAKALDMPIGEVYGVATFYSFLATKPQGRNIIRVCKSLPCFLKNYQMITESIADETGIKPGETTPDGRFSFQLTNCIGACDKAPAMMINSDVHTDLTPDKIARILRAYK
jgi:NADH-quinone oxidoreductase E subunit